MPFGSPCVNGYSSENEPFSALMLPMTVLKSMIGDIMGSVIFVNFLIGPAPSISHAS